MLCRLPRSWCGAGSEGICQVRLRVLKFGGTSLHGRQNWNCAVRRVQSCARRDHSLLVVVSAMGRRGSPYSTDTLIDFAESFADPSPLRELDLIMSCGEIVAAVAFSGALRTAGTEATALTGGQAGILTDDRFGEARILRVSPSEPLRLLRQNQVPVVAGFQGVSEDGETTTLGRGGSDITAAALAVALGAELVEICTDVDGIKTADPRLVSDARTLGDISYEELFQLARQGAHVVHPRACQMVMAGGVPLRVRSACNDHPGTMVTAGRLNNSRPVTGVAHAVDVGQIRVVGEHDDAEQVFGVLASAGISVDMINVSPGEIAFAVNGRLLQRAMRKLEKAGYHPRGRSGCAKISTVGAGMRGVPGVMARIVQTLRAVGVDILQTCDSHLSINCLVAEEDVGRAVRALHRHFQLDRMGGSADER